MSWHLSTGFLGTPRLLPVLTDTGHTDIAYRLLTQRTFPSWGYQIDHGATTMWERWDSLWPDGAFQDPGMNSFNHYAYGSVGEWMYAHIAGIAPGRPGYREVVVRPRPGGGISEARATLTFVRGPVWQPVEAPARTLRTMRRAARCSASAPARTGSPSELHPAAQASLRPRSPTEALDAGTSLSTPPQAPFPLHADTRPPPCQAGRRPRSRAPVTPASRRSPLTRSGRCISRTAAAAGSREEVRFHGHRAPGVRAVAAAPDTVIEPGVTERLLWRVESFEPVR